MNAPNAPATADWPLQIRALEDEARRCFQAQDVARLDELWSDDLLVNSPLNRVSPKQQVLELLRTGVILHASFESKIESLERRGDVAVVMGEETVSDKPDTPTYRRRFTNVWRLEDGRWRLFIRHANIAP